MTPPTESTLNQTLSHNLRLLYAQHGRTLEEFSAQLGVGRTTLGKLLRGRCNVTLDTVEVMARGLAVEPLSLLSPQGSRLEERAAALTLELLPILRDLSPEHRRLASLQLTRLLETLGRP